MFLKVMRRNFKLDKITIIVRSYHDELSIHYLIGTQQSYFFFSKYVGKLIDLNLEVSKNKLKCKENNQQILNINE